MATAAEHYAQGEAILDRVGAWTGDLTRDGYQSILTEALAHFVAAVAAELGVPTGTPHTGIPGTGDASTGGQGITTAPGGGG